MLATSTRQPSRSKGGRSQRPATESGPSTSSRRRSSAEQVELGQAGVAQPALVACPGGRGSRRTPAPASRRPQRPAEPGVGVAAVVGGEVAEQVPDPAAVDRLRRGEPGPVAAEQRVDLVEGGGVVAVVRLAPGRTASGRAALTPSRLDVVEVLDRCRRGRRRRAAARWTAARVDRVVPGRGPGPGRPGRRRPAPSGRSGRGRSGRRRASRAQAGGGGANVTSGSRSTSGTSWAWTPVPLQPAVARGAALEQEAVAGHRVAHRDLGAPPRLGRRLPVDGRLASKCGSASGVVRTHAAVALDARRHAQVHGDDVAERRRVVGRHVATGRRGAAGRARPQVPSSGHVSP